MHLRSPDNGARGASIRFSCHAAHPCDVPARSQADAVVAHSVGAAEARHLLHNEASNDQLPRERAGVCLLWIILHRLSRRALDALQRARDEIAPAFTEEKCFTDLRLTGVRLECAVHEEAQAAEELAAQSEVTRKPFARPAVAHGHA